MIVNIEKLDAVSILQPIIFAELIDLESEVEKVELEEALIDRAEVLGVKQKFLRRLDAYKKDNKRINKACVDNDMGNIEDEAFSWEYIVKGRYGYTVNPSILADYIRSNSNYLIVRKRGSNTDFIYWYEDGYYKRISTNELKGKIKEFIPISIRKPRHWDDCFKELITDNCSVDFEQLNKDTHIINFKNGLYNTKTRQLEPHDPKYLQTIQLNCNYDPRAPEPTTWLKFIDSLANGDKDTIETLQQWFGFTISNYEGYKLKKMMALYGIVGNTGKTRFTNMLTYIIGRENICSTMLQELSDNFGSGSLYGTHCIIIDDQTAAPLEDSSVVKALTGSGEITMKLKGVDNFLYHYTGTITFNCNAMFYCKGDKGEHVFQRFLIIPCDNIIPEEKRDKDLDEKLRKEVDGIAKWAIEGLHTLMDNNFSITISEASKQALEEYRANSDTVFRYLKECDKYTLTNKYEDRVLQKSFNDDYLQWCIDNGYESLKRKNIEASMKGKGVKCVTIKGYKYYKGVTDMPF